MNASMPLLVAAGGALGSLTRWLCGMWVQRASGSGFPFGTLTVNVVGSFAIGLLLGIGEAKGGITDAWRAFAITGVLGGFTTFSAFSAETLGLVQRAHYGAAALNVAASIVLGLAAAAGGFAVARAVT